MKKSFTSVIKLAALLICTAAALWACQNEESGESWKIQTKIYKSIDFHAVEMSTKTAFGPGENGVFPTLWTANDCHVKLALNYTEAAEVPVVPDEGGRTASFTADIDGSGTQSPYTFYAVSPATAAKALSPSRQAWSISIPAEQTPLEGSPDEAAQIIAATSAASSALPGSVDLHFNHLTAYGRMSFSNLELNGAEVQKVEITATTPLVGDWYWNCNGDHELADNGASSTITLNTSRTSDIWFACAPVDLSGEIAVFTIYTDQGALVKEVEFAQGRSFQAGRIAVFSVNMEGITLGSAPSDDFVLVTDTTTLQDGDEILILNAEETYALGTNQKPNNREAAAISVSDHTVSVVPSDVQVITLVASASNSGYWNMQVSDGYLANANGTKNKLVTVAGVTNNATWKITIESTGKASVVAQSGDKNILRFNPNKSNGSPLFACYSDGQDPVVIYRKGGAGQAGPVAENPLCSESLFGMYQGSSSTRKYTAGTDQYLRQYAADGVQTFVILNPANKEQLEITGYKRSLVKGDIATITVSWKKGKSKVINSKTYPVKLVKENGPVVWLADDKGNGFIIKK